MPLNKMTQRTRNTSDRPQTDPN